jgi:hypothetical protein
MDICEVKVNNPHYQMFPRRAQWLDRAPNALMAGILDGAVAIF